MDRARHTLVVDDLRDLIAEHFPPCVSIYLPTNRGGRVEDRRRLKNAVRRVRVRLEQAHPDLAINEFLAPLEETPDAFLRGLVDGLAIFHSHDLSMAYALPMEFPELTIVASSFHVRPLLRFLQMDRHFYLLSLGEKHVDFFRGDASKLSRRRVPALPRSLVDALGVPERQRTISSHSTGAHGNMPIFHGQEVENAHEEDIARFLREVDNALWPVLREEKAPLILAATERMHPVFHAITRYAHVTEEGLRGNFERATLNELHRRAFPIIQKHIDADLAEVSERYQRAVSRGRALDEVQAIAKLAVEGRIWELLLARNAELWGTLEEESGDLKLQDERMDGQEDDVLDDIAEAVLLRGGEVFSFDQDRMPTQSPVAAILRW